MDDPRALLLVRDLSYCGRTAKPELSRVGEISELRERLAGFGQLPPVVLRPGDRGHTVFATFDVRNKMERDRIQAFINERLQGWTAYDLTSYSLPRTF